MMNLHSAIGAHHTKIEETDIVRRFPNRFPPEQHWMVKLYDWFEKPVVARWNFIITLGLTIALVFLSACATLEKNPATAKLATQYAVAKYIENSAADKRADRKARIVSIALQIKTAAMQQSATVGALSALAYVEIDKLHLSVADTVLAKGLVDFIAEEIKTRVAAHQLSPENVVLVSTFVDWIVQAAS